MNDLSTGHIIFLVIGSLHYFAGLFFLLSRSDEIVKATDDIAQFLSVEGRLVLLLIHALLLILWPIVMWAGIIKITYNGKWGEIFNKKKPPPR